MERPDLEALCRLRPDDGLAGSYSGPEVRIEEVRFRRKWLALSSPRTPFLGGFFIGPIFELFPRYSPQV